MGDELYLDNVSCDSVCITLTPKAEDIDIFLYPTKVGFLATRPPYFFDQSTSASDGYLIVFTVSGTGVLHYNNINYLLEMYSVTFVPCDTEYRFSTSNNDYRWRFLFMNFNGKQAKDFYNYIMHGKEPVGTLENTAPFMSLMWQIINRYKSETHELFAGLNTNTNILEIMTEIARINTPALYYNHTYPAYLKEIYYYIDSHYTEKITLDKLEREFSISKYYIARQFKEYSGITINDYIMIKRISRAKFLLKHTSQSISEIAEEIGFFDAGHFINQFKAREFITPHSYRKAVLSII